MSRLRVEFPSDVIEALVEHVTEGVLKRLAEQPSGKRPEFLSVAEAADVLRAKPQRVYDLLSAHRLPRYKDGSRVLVRRADLDEYLANCRRRVAPRLPRASLGRMKAEDAT
jgi:excisionase family DNA binding protein